MYKICIIGGGQIGSRHLQGLTPINVPCEIFVVDPSQASLEVARQRFQEVIKGRNLIEDIHYIQDMVHLPTDLDLCIVATSSRVRYEIMDYMTRSHKVRNYILEKVVFQSNEQFNTILTRIDAQESRAWVNCPRRMYPGYQELKKRLKDEKNISIEVTGGDWGLGCNAIHFLDLLAYFSDESNLTIDPSQLEPHIYDSKRKGYVEFSGSITGRLNGGNSITLTSQVEATTTNKIVFETDNITATVDEVGKKVELSSSDPSIKPQILPFECLFQSQLTYHFVQDILQSNSCSLPTLEESANIHKPLIEAFMSHLNQYGDKYYDRCPIT